MADDNDAGSYSPEPEGDYWRFLRSMEPDCSDPLPEEDDDIDPDFMDDLTNKLQRMIDRGILAGPGQDGALGGHNGEGGVHETTGPVARAVTPPPSMPQTTSHLQHQDDGFQPPVCLRTRARHPMTDVDINELEGQLGPDVDTMNLPDEHFEDSTLWDLLNSPTPFDFDALDASDLDIDLDLEDPALLEALQGVLNTEASAPENKEQTQELAQDQTNSGKGTNVEGLLQNTVTEGGSQRDFFSPAFLDDCDGAESMNVPTLLVDTPFATIPMKSNTWNEGMIQQLHTLFKGHGQMLLQAYGLSVGHAHLMGEAAEVQKMLDSLSVMRITKAQLSSYPRMVSNALKNQKASTSVATQNPATSVGPSSREAPPSSHPADEGQVPTTGDNEKEGDPASSPTLGLSTVTDLPFLDVLPYLWCAIKCLSCEPSTSVPSGQEEGLMGKMFKSKGFCSQIFPPAIKKAFEPLKVFLPELLDIKVEPRGDFWCMAEELLLQWGMIVHPSNWEAIQQTYLTAKKKKEIEHRESSSERRRKRKPFRILHDSSAPLSFNDLVPQVPMCRPDLRQVLTCLEQLSQLGRKYFGKSGGESLFGMPTPKLPVNRTDVIPQLQPCSEPKWALPSTRSQTANAVVLPQAIEGQGIHHLQSSGLGLAGLGDTQPSSSQTINGAKETINGAQHVINQAHERISLAQEVINGAQKTINQAQETIGRAQQTIDKAQEDMNKQQSLHWLAHCNQLQGRELACFKEHLLIMLGQQSSHLATFINQMDAADAARIMSSSMGGQLGANQPLSGLPPTWDARWLVKSSEAASSTMQNVAAVANLINSSVGESRVDVGTPRHSTMGSAGYPPTHYGSLGKVLRCTDSMSMPRTQPVEFNQPGRQPSALMDQAIIGGPIAHHLKPLRFTQQSVDGGGSGVVLSQNLTCLSGGGPSTSCLGESHPQSCPTADGQENSVSSEHALSPIDVDNINTDVQPSKRQKMGVSNGQEAPLGGSSGGNGVGVDQGYVVGRSLGMKGP